jgi:hypothetical protein
MICRHGPNGIASDSDRFIQIVDATSMLESHAQRAAKIGLTPRPLRVFG